jgi:pimeloyl-ACP methyl ester carboxylesterase
MNEDATNTQSHEPQLSSLSTDPASITKSLQTSAPALTNADRAELRPACPPPLAWVDVLHEFREASKTVDVDFNGFKISARVWGSGQPLYFLNGICGDSDVFCLLGWLIQNDFRCVMVDFPDTKMPIESYSQGLFAVADQLGDDTFDLFAASFGTAVAIEAALLHPERCDHVVLQGPLGDFKLSFFEWAASQMLRWLPFKLKHLPLRRKLHKATHRLWYPPLDETRWEFHLDNSGQTKASQVARRALWLNRTSLEFKRVELPVLLISGEGEAPRYVDAARQMAREMPAAQHEQLSNSGHVPYITHPHRVANLLKPFLIESYEPIG